MVELLGRGEPPYFLMAMLDPASNRRASVIDLQDGELTAHLGLSHNNSFAGYLLTAGSGDPESIADLLASYFGDAVSAVTQPGATWNGSGPLPTKGYLQVLTASGALYVVDLGLMLLKRLRTDTSDPQVTARLRRDGDALKILRIKELTVGRDAVFDLEPLGDPRLTTHTTRTTTPVLAIAHSLDNPLADASGGDTDA
jgi:hypothetical protein